MIFLMEQHRISFFISPMVGIPFKVLDKKSEKKLIISRRKALTLQLQHATIPTEVFELALVLLCQQTRSLVVCRDQINEPVMRWILEEKKISSEVCSIFTKVYSFIKEEVCTSNADVEKMKEFGLTKDISNK